MYRLHFEIKRNSIIVIVYLTLIALIFYSCENHKENEMVPLTEQAAMDSLIEMPPVEGAKFYKVNRGEYTFLDKLYNDSIVPALKACNYYELKEICGILKNTACYYSVDEFFKEKKKEYISSVTLELEQNCKIEKETFEKIIMPAIEMGVDSMLDEDIGAVFSKYAGGLLNYRKLHFLFGRDRNDFKDMFWEKLDTAKYQEHIRTYIQAYLDTINLKQKEYCLQIVNKEFNNKMILENPMMKIGLTSSTLKHIQKYTLGQKDEILEEAVKDYVVPLALAGVSGGVSTLYDIGTTVYDISVTIDDIKKQNVNPDDMVKYVCVHDLSFQIENYYMPQCKDIVMDLIDESNKKLLNYIISNL